VTGNASTATTLATGRTIALTGDVTGTTGTFNGSANVSAATTIANNAVTTAKIAAGNVTLDRLVAAVQEALVPVGGILPFGRTAAPAGWLACNGQAVSRSTYSALFSAIGTGWGAGNGSTTFNLPDLRDRFLRHAGPSFSGGVGTRQADEIKSHNHTASSNSTGAHTHTASTGSAGNHNHTASTDTTGAHTHNYTFRSGTMPQSGSATQCWVGSSTATTSSAGAHSHTVTVNSAGAHTHTVSVGSNGAHSHTITVNNTGGTENRPLSATVLYCIKF
jgi:microcystin-dependent protein